MNANGKCRMRIHASMRIFATIAGALLLGSAAASDVDAAYRIGQYWEYSLEGPRPGAVEPKAIDGRRIVQVVGNLAAYPLERDRHLIYIDSALASMQLMLAAETLGLSTCPINWPDVDFAEQNIQQLTPTTVAQAKQPSPY